MKSNNILSSMLMVLNASNKECDQKVQCWFCEYSAYCTSLKQTRDVITKILKNEGINHD